MAKSPTPTQATDALIEDEEKNGKQKKEKMERNTRKGEEYST